MQFTRSLQLGALSAIVLFVVAGHAQTPQTQTPAGRGAAAGRGGSPAVRRTTEVGGRLAPSEQKYAAIDERKLMQDVEALTAIARRYRDNGHPQFWGRIIGTEADAENAQWLMDRFKKLGLSDVKMETIDLTPQWIAKSWAVSASAGGKTIQVNTAQPTSLSDQPRASKPHSPSASVKPTMISEISASRFTRRC